jgi:hypothetical protein
VVKLRLEAESRSPLSTGPAKIGFLGFDREGTATMTRRIQISLLAAVVALGVRAPAEAQAWGMRGPSLWDYTGVLLPGASIPPQIPNTWITPNYVFDYQVPQVVYVPIGVPVAAPLPAFETVQVASIQLRHGSVSGDRQVKAGTVVTWRNGEDQDQILVIAPSPSSTQEAAGSPQRWRVPARGSFSVLFHQPGTYDYYLLDAAGQRAHLTVTE